MSISTIILLILGIIILVILALGFSVGWNKILPFVSQDNVNTIAQQCNIACTTNSEFDFCSKQQELRVNGSVYTDSCYKFSTNTSYISYGITVCPSLQSACVAETPAATEENPPNPLP